MDKSTVEVFHARLDSMLRGLLAEYNGEISKSHITYSDSGLKISIETIEKNSDGSIKVDTLTNAKMVAAIRQYWSDCPDSVVGLEFYDDKSMKWRIIDWNNRARTYPLVCKDRDGKLSRWAPSYVAKQLKANYAKSA